MAGILKASEVNTLGRLKQVSKLHFRGFSTRKIAEEMDMPIRSVERDVATITDRIREFDDIEKTLKDLVGNTQVELTKLNELEAEQWKQLDHASERVVQTDAFGNALFELNQRTGEKTQNPILGPRSPGHIISSTNALLGIGKQRAELLKLIGPKVDITVRLQLQQKVQTRILEAIQGADPALYAQIYREIQVIAETSTTQTALNPGRDTIDAEYTEVDDVDE